MFRAPAMLVAMLALAGANVAEARQTGGPTLLRVFLLDGTAFASLGEWARLDDRIVFSMPLTAGATELQLVTIPADRIDWARTERYADAARAAQYAATRGEDDFARLSADVAAALNDVALISDPARRLARAEAARRELAAWPGTHFGYRGAEVREIVGLLDEVISELRAAAGADRFEFTLVADGAPPAEPLLPAPAEAEIVDHLMRAADLAATPAERVGLLETVLRLLDRAVDFLPATWAAGIRRTALAGVEEERALDRQYAALRVGVLGEASRYAARADVRGIERLLATVHDRDAALGRRRPEVVSGLVGALGAQLEAARQLRLAQDRWQLQIRSYRAYHRAVRAPLSALADATPGLEDIRALAGPAPAALQSMATRLTRHGARLALVTPPPTLEPVHALLRSAWDLAQNAVRLRLDAVALSSLDRARDASAAAAGALLLVARARADLEAALAPPLRP
ncbi:MAG: hypothetical protein AB1635_09395 [Acidobacteriota bacterium]